MAGHYVVLSGGVGGAKLVYGLKQVLPADQLVVVANTADDFEHLGLPICPDIDTLIYTLADMANTDTGWGQTDESWHFMAALEKLGGETWFRLGDRDLATHVQRRMLLEQGFTLSKVTAELCERLGLETQILPMSDDPVRTILTTGTGKLGFQDYFVRLQTEPSIENISYTGSDVAAPAPGVVAALNSPDLRGIIISPSNPWLSIDPILSIAQLKPMITLSKVPVVAISPIVGGRAIKGPTAKLMGELGVETSVTGIAEHYKSVIDGLIIDECDTSYQTRIEALCLKAGVAQTVMHSTADKVSLANATLEFVESIARENAQAGHQEDHEDSR